MVETKSIETVVEKWKRKVGAAQGDYANGVMNPKTDWATATKAAEDRYKQGVTKAASEGRFGKGVAKAGTEKWKKGATEKGPSRWAEGVNAAEDEYRSGMGEVLNVIQGTQLPPRGAAGDPRNYERVKAIGQKLHDHFKGR